MMDALTPLIAKDHPSQLTASFVRKRDSTAQNLQKKSKLTGTRRQRKARVLELLHPN